MKIGFDVSQAIYGTGVSDYTTSLIKHFPVDLIQPVGFSLRRQSELADLFPKAKTFPIPPSFLAILWNNLHILPVECFVGKVDIFHSSDWTQPPSYAKKVTTIHDLSPFIYPEHISPNIVKTHTSRMRWAVKEVDKFICVSQNTATDLERIFNLPTEKISVIYESIPEKLLLTPQASPYQNYILAMGSKQPRKNISKLISAFKKYKSKLNLPEKLVITGENILASADSDVIFTGYVSDQDLVNLFAHAEVFVYPSLYEGFGQPILEGFYFQAPVVTGNNSSLPEVAGEAAILVNVTSEQDLAEGILEAIRQKKNLTKAGQLQLKKFSWEKAATETIEIYKSLL